MDAPGNVPYMRRKLNEMLLYEAENILSVSQICIHSQQLEAGDFVLLKRFSPHPSPPPLPLSPSDPGLAYRDSGLSLNQYWIMSKDCAHLLPQVCLAAGGYTLGPESMAVGL